MASSPPVRAESPSYFASSRLDMILNQDMYSRIDEFERRMDENVLRKRRRIANLLGETSTHRPSHLRLFVTHHETERTATTTSSGGRGGISMSQPQQQPDDLMQQQQHKWTLVIEGKLLVGHLDHQSVEQIEQEARDKALQQQEGKISTASTPGSKQQQPHDLGSTFSHDALLTRSTDRTLYRGKNEQEGEGEVEPIEFTHFFDKVAVSFQTVYQPLVKQPSPPKADTTTPKKKGRNSAKKKQKSSPQVVAALDERLLTTSETSSLTWNRPPSTGEARRFYDATAATTDQDAHAFLLPYMTPPPRDPLNQQVHSVVATIQLYPRTGSEPLFLCSPQLSDALFPQHSPIPPATTTKKKSKKKRRRSSPVMEEEKDDTPPIPLDNDMFVPPTIRMKDVIMGLFTYIQHHHLCDKNEPSVIVCDKLLQSLFGCEKLNFADVQQLLLSKQLLTDASVTPVTLTYIMSKDTASLTLEQEAIMMAQATTSAAEQDHAPTNVPSMLSLDMDVSVANLFPSRARELMRRIKRREFEYTNSRTRARNLLVRSHEDTCRAKIDDCVVGRGYAPEYIPVWLALAKGAPPMSEARAAAQMDAKTCGLLQELEHHSRAAQAAWEVVEACRWREVEPNTEKAS